MKTLILIRHAKSSWQNPDLPDRLRPLNRRGERDAPEMGQRLAARGIEADLLISSPATRALATAEIIAEEIDYPPEEIVADKRIYNADASDLLEVIQGLHSSLDCVILVGHNPGLTDLFNDLSPFSVDNLPTCAIVTLEYNVDTWAQAGDGQPFQVDLDYPKKQR